MKNLLLILFFMFNFGLFAQVLDTAAFQDAGVAVSPSHIRLNLKPGQSKTVKITVNNQTKKNNKFRVIYKDYEMKGDGNSEFSEKMEKFGLSKWMNISPSYFEMKPGEKKEISVSISIPNNDESNIAAWNAIFIEQAIERKSLDPGNANGQTIAMGVIPTFTFGVWVSQNPPDMSIQKVEIEKLFYERKNNKDLFILDLNNTGNGISFCKAYVEITNLKTGEQQKLGGQAYTILPMHKRTFKFDSKTLLSTGKYSVMGVVDYGSTEEIVAAELEFTVE